MKSTIHLLLISMMFVNSYSCSKSDKASISDEDVIKYINVYKKLKENAPKMLEATNSNTGNTDIAKDQYNDFENIVKEGGISNYASFVKLNAKIGAIFSIMQASRGMDQFQEMKDSGSEVMSEKIKEFQKLIDDPNTPEEAKSKYRDAIKELENASEKIEKNWAKNKKWADFVMDKANKVQGLFVSQPDIDMVKRHEQDIMEAYAGFKTPQTENVDFRKIFKE